MQTAKGCVGVVTPGFSARWRALSRDVMVVASVVLPNPALTLSLWLDFAEC